VIAGEVMIRTIYSPGQHQQFRWTCKHPLSLLWLSLPPDGYAFETELTKDASQMPDIHAAGMRFVRKCLFHDVPIETAARLVFSRNLDAQFYFARGGLHFISSFPYVIDHADWVIEIESAETLFDPFLPFGQREQSPTLAFNTPEFETIRILLESSRCRAIVTHMEDTANSVRRMFAAYPKITEKVFYVKSVAPPIPENDLREVTEARKFLFVNSWGDIQGHIENRGGLEVLEAFNIVSRMCPDIELTLRCEIPPDLSEYHREIIRTNEQIGVIDQILPDDQYRRLLRDTDVFLLPSWGIHSHSTLTGLARGHVLVASDGWGFSELLRDDDNAMIARGHYGKRSWLDQQGHVHFRFAPLRAADPKVVKELAIIMWRLATEAGLAHRVAQAGRKSATTELSPEAWKSNWREIYDRIWRDEALPDPDDDERRYPLTPSKEQELLVFGVTYAEELEQAARLPRCHWELNEKIA
jgi:hypothetical protein